MHKNARIFLYNLPKIRKRNFFAVEIPTIRLRRAIIIKSVSERSKYVHLFHNAHKAQP